MWSIRDGPEIASVGEAVCLVLGQRIVGSLSQAASRAPSSLHDEHEGRIAVGLEETRSANDGLSVEVRLRVTW